MPDTPPTPPTPLALALTALADATAELNRKAAALAAAGTATAADLALVGERDRAVQRAIGPALDAAIAAMANPSPLPPPAAPEKATP